MTIKKLGFNKKNRYGKKSITAADKDPSDMGIKAAILAINKAQIQPEKIDLIAYCGVGYYDYRFWSPAAKI